MPAVAPLSIDWKPLAEDLHPRFSPCPALEDEISDGEILSPEQGYTLRGAVSNVVESAAVPEPASDDLTWDREDVDHESVCSCFYRDLFSRLSEFCLDFGGPVRSICDLYLWKLPRPDYFV